MSGPPGLGLGFIAGNALSGGADQLIKVGDDNRKLSMEAFMEEKRAALELANAKSLANYKQGLDLDTTRKAADLRLELLAKTEQAYIDAGKQDEWLAMSMEERLAVAAGNTGNLSALRAAAGGGGGNTGFLFDLSGSVPSPSDWAVGSFEGTVLPTLPANMQSQGMQVLEELRTGKRPSASRALQELRAMSNLPDEARSAIDGLDRGYAQATDLYNMALEPTVPGETDRARITRMQKMQALAKNLGISLADSPGGYAMTARGEGSPAASVSATNTGGATPPGYVSPLGPNQSSLRLPKWAQGITDPDQQELIIVYEQNGEQGLAKVAQDIKNKAPDKYKDKTVGDIVKELKRTIEYLRSKAEG